MRILMYCGKGGCGKSTLAVATALRAAQEGARTLLFSLDPAHSLGAILGRPVGADPTPIAERVWAAELDAVASLSQTWGEARQYAEALLRNQFDTPGAGGELALVPGIAELGALARLAGHLDAGAFDAVVLDHAPTAYALRLLALPALASGYGRKGRLLHERYGAQAMLGLSMLGAQVPLPPPGALERTLEALARLEALPGLLADPAVTSARLVTPADPVGLQEARHLYTWLSLYGITVDEVMMNPMWPQAIADPLLETWRAREAALLAEAEAAFAPVHVVPVSRRAEPLLGPEALLDLGLALWPNGGALARRGDHAALRIRADGAGLEVAIRLPFVDRKAVELAKHGDELYITLGGHQRIVRLPEAAAAMSPSRARFAEDTLLVTLSPAA